MRLVSILSTGMIGAIIPMYIFNHGIRSALPLFLALVCAVVGGMIFE